MDCRRAVAALLSLFSVCGAAAEDPSSGTATQPVVPVHLNSSAETATQPIESVNLLFNAPGGRKLNLIMYGVREGQKTALKKALEDYYSTSILINMPLKLIDAPFIDAEKYEHDPDRKIDSGYCWACSVSNMLWNSGWAKNCTKPLSSTNSKFASEDEVFAYYYSRFSNYGVGNIAGAVDWFFMGEFYNLTYSQEASLKTDNDKNDGRKKEFVSSLIQTRYYLPDDAAMIRILEMCDWTKEGASVFQANIGTLLDGGLYASEHAVTIVGIITDPNASSIKDYYKAILIVDSDNDATPTAEQKAAEQDNITGYDEDGLPIFKEDFLKESRKARPNSVTVYPLELLEDVHHTPYWHVVGYVTDDPHAIYDINRLPIYKDGLVEQYKETEGNKQVYNTVDLTLEGLFTTDRTEAIRTMQGKEEKELTVRTFDPGALVNLNFFVANRSAIELNDVVRNGQKVTVDWSVVRDTDGTVAASGRYVCEGVMLGQDETGFMIHLNEKDGTPETWLPGSYTVILDLNKARTFTESYYRNNLQKRFSFTIRGEMPAPTSAPDPQPTPAPTILPKTGDNAPLTLWLGLILIGTIGLCLLVVQRRKDRNDCGKR